VNHFLRGKKEQMGGRLGGEILGQLVGNLTNSLEGRGSISQKKETTSHMQKQKSRKFQEKIVQTLVRQKFPVKGEGVYVNAGEKLWKTIKTRQTGIKRAKKGNRLSGLLGDRNGAKKRRKRVSNKDRPRCVLRQADRKKKKQHRNLIAYK